MFESQKQKENASWYFQTVYKLLVTTQVTGILGEEIPLDEGGDRAAQMICGLLKAANKSMVIGNGGSAALASHTQNDLCKSVGVPSLNFTEVPLLTSLTNDNGYSAAFEHQVNLWAKPGDLLIAISSSGCSENILRASQAAQNHNCHLITLSGFRTDNALRNMGELNFYVPVEDYGFVESVHAILLHFLTDRATKIKEIFTR